MIDETTNEEVRESTSNNNNIPNSLDSNKKVLFTTTSGDKMRLSHKEKLSKDNKDNKEVKEVKESKDNKEGKDNKEKSKTNKSFRESNKINKIFIIKVDQGPFYDNNPNNQKPILDKLTLCKIYFIFLKS